MNAHLKNKKSSHFNLLIPIILVMVMLLGFSCEKTDNSSTDTDNDSAPQATGNITTYEFITEQSNVSQSGGFAGVNKKYPVTGQFRLLIDGQANKASFEHVNAKMDVTNGFLQNDSLSDLFNMPALEGTITTQKTIEFKGKTLDPQPTPSDVAITGFKSNSPISS